MQPITVSETSDANTNFKGGGVQCRAEDLSKRLYGDICGKVASSSLLPCVLDLCRVLWSIMDSYKVYFTFLPGFRLFKSNLIGGHTVYGHIEQFFYL